MVRDPDAHNHDVHNDTLGAVMDIGFGSFLYSATVALNIKILPWSDGAFGRKIIQAADFFRKFSSSSHPVFQHFAETIGHEKGLSGPETASNTLSGVGAGGSKSSCLCEGFLVTSLLVVLIRAKMMRHGCPQGFFKGTL